jgi:hypothetical protein
LLPPELENFLPDLEDFLLQKASAFVSAAKPVTLAPSCILKGVPPPELLKLRTLQRGFLDLCTPCRILALNYAIRPKLICGFDLKVSLSLSLLEGI